MPNLPSFLRPDQVTQDPSDLETYGRDWTRAIAPNASGVLFPESTDEVKKIVLWANDTKTALVPSGGRTGLAGGAVASVGEWVLSLSRMKRMDPVHVSARSLRVQAGAVTQAVHEHCASFGLTWPVDFASKGSSQVGGNIATNAGGVRVVRYGLTRNWVLGLQVVDGRGIVHELNGLLEKNNSGPDLKHLFIGTEGIYGIITEAELKLAPLPSAEAEVFLFSLAGLDQVFRLFEEARQGPFQLNAFECMALNCVESVVRHRNLRTPFQDANPYWVLMEVEPESLESRDAWLESLFSQGLVENGTLAQSSQEREDFWALREGISESLAALGQCHKHDISLPLDHVQSFISDFLPQVKSKYGQFEVYLFGHIGDGNLHINCVKPTEMTREEFATWTAPLDESIYQLVANHQGSISAEHGIGLIKKKALHFTKSETEIRWMKEIKSFLDPNGILNPGKIF